jgi:hypothetical protein
MLSSRAFVCGLIVLLVSVSMAVSASPEPGSPFTPKAPALTRADVDKLVRILPELAKQSGELRVDPALAMRPGGSGLARLPTEDIERVEKILSKHGYTFPQFLMQLTTLVSTYIALKPQAFDDQLPTEKSPEIKKILDDPEVSETRKTELRAQIRDAQANKELLRNQITAFVSEENKRVVRPLLGKVRGALEAAKKEAERARKK